MTPRLSVLIATLALTATPLPAFAQTWQAGVVAAAPRSLPAPARAFVVLRDDDVSLRRRPSVPPTDPRAPRLRLQADAADLPEVDIRPKAEWSDDEGLRLSPTRVAFKRRF